MDSKQKRRWFRLNNITKDFLESFMNEIKTKSYDSSAEVMRIENTTAWVHIPGGVDETPVELNISAKPGDKVKVRVSDGRAYIIGNMTAPPTDDAIAKKANSKINDIVKNKLPKLDKTLVYLESLLNKYGAWINIGVDSENRPVLELGKETSQNKLRLTNEDIQFLLNDFPIGLIDGNRQKINFVNINEQLILSKHWFFEQNKEGNLNIIWRK